MRPIIFNLTRLINRQHYTHATGVDRLDIQHARTILTYKKTTTIFFVYQVKNTFILIPLNKAEILIEKLWHKWSGNKKTDISKSTHKKINLYFLYAYGVARNVLKKKLCNKLQQQLTKLSAPIYINSGHANLQYQEIHRHLKTTWKANMIFYLHDLIPVDFPEYSASSTEIHIQRLHTIINTGDLVLTNSQHTKNRFTAYCENNHYTCPSTQVLHIGVEQHIIEAASQTKPAIETLPEQKTHDKPYFVILGTIEPRKNHLMLLHIWRDMSKTLKDQCPLLLIIGKRGWRIQHITDMLNSCPALQNNVIEINNANDHELITYLQHAQALLFPSFEEGWGIPITEALTLGTPVICSDIPALREASQELATYIDPLDTVEWNRIIQKALKFPQRNQKFTPTTWKQHNNTLKTIFSNR